MGSVVGLDIGYSNLKFAFQGESGAMETRLMASGAGPLENMPDRVDGSRAAVDYMQVMVDGEKWVAGVDQGRLQGWNRELHRDYPASKSYRALFHAALLANGSDVVTHLITGLPANQAADLDEVKRLQSRLKGVHQITPKRSIEVQAVTVLAQPVGSYLDLVNSFEDPELLAEAHIVVIDPGFFSVDWVPLLNGEVRRKASGTSVDAMSVLLETASGLIGEDHGSGVGIEKLEKAVRAGESTVLLYGQRLEIGEYLKAAARKIAPVALTAMRQSMRSEDLAVDIVLLTGGGANAYEDAAREIFPRSRVIVPSEPVLSNARGFYRYGA